MSFFSLSCFFRFFGFLFVYKLFYFADYPLSLICDFAERNSVGACGIFNAYEVYIALRIYNDESYGRCRNSRSASAAEVLLVVFFRGEIRTAADKSDGNL